MARKPRFNLPGYPQHVIQRGNNRGPTFFSPQDYRFYLDCLHDACRQRGCAVHAYVLMTNHVHLLMTPEEKFALSWVMQDVGRRYVRYLNRQYGRSGTLWEGRFKASLVQSERYLLICSRYIELNPVRAKMVAHPFDYRWSSYAANAEGQADPVLAPHPDYRRLGCTLADCQRAYRQLFRSHLSDETLQEVREALNRELVFGNLHFKSAVEATAKRQAHPGKPGRPKEN